MFFVLVGLFLLFSGAFTIEILLFGIGISLAICFFMSRFMNYNIKKEIKILKSLPYIIAYFFVLIFEVIKANICTISFVAKGNKAIHPVIVSFDSPLKSDFLSVILANSITLTPGTISVSLKEGKFRVHCLDQSMCEGIGTSSLVRLLKKIESR